MRIKLTAMVLAAALAGGLAGGASAADSSREELDALVESLGGNGCDAARAKRLTRRKDFAALDSSQRSLAWSIVAMCDPKAQQEALLKATVEPDAMAVAWSLRARDLATRGQLAEAVAALDAAVDRRSDGSFYLEDTFAFDLAGALRDDDKTFNRYAWALYRAEWRPADPFYGGDWIWVKLARLQLEADRPEDARRVLERVEGPEDLLKVAVDKRFDRLALPADRFAYVALTERLVERHKKLLAERPRDGLGIVTLSMRLRLLGRQQEALDLVDQVLASPDPIYDDKGGDHRNWVVNERALVLHELGRGDEAVRAMQAAAQLKEDGEATNVSQTINLATLLNALGRHEEALATLAAFDRLPANAASPYGWLLVWTERTCALRRLGREAEADKAAEYTAANAKHSQTLRLKAALCLGDLDAAAEALKAQLADAGTRGGALTTLSRFRHLPARTAFNVEMDQRLAAVRARADVAEAVAAAGRTPEVPLYATGINDFF